MFFWLVRSLILLQELTSGHINDTFLVTTKQQHKYVFQKINKGVFPDVPGLIGNKVNISSHLHHKLSNLTKKERQRQDIDFFTDFWWRKLLY